MQRSKLKKLLTVQFLKQRKLDLVGVELGIKKIAQEQRAKSISNSKLVPPQKDEEEIVIVDNEDWDIGYV